MMMASLPTLSVKLSQPRRNCILDPALALSRYGLPLVKQLGTVMDLWLGRELKHILENPQFYLQHPELLLLNRSVPSNRLDRSFPLLQDTIRALQEWEQIRQETDLANLKLFWVGDRPSESWLPRGIEPAIIWHYESFARSLESQIDKHLDESQTSIPVFRDTVALAAILNSSFILTHQLPQESAAGFLPGISLDLESWGIPCQVVASEDAMAAIERDYLRQLFVQVGLSKFFWDGLRLNVLHLFVPFASHFSIVSKQAGESQFFKSHRQSLHLETSLWEGSRGFWYQL
jgi:hypothetical protein